MKKNPKYNRGGYTSQDRDKEYLTLKICDDRTAKRFEFLCMIQNKSRRVFLNELLEQYMDEHEDEIISRYVQLLPKEDLAKMVRDYGEGWR